MEVIVEIDENERYWVGGGFGSRGLLPNDRGPFSTTDGSMFWKSPDEASEDLVLLGRGWTYKESEFTPGTQWMYATDFRPESIKRAKPKRGMMHWVRFRRLYRTKTFNPDEFVEYVLKLSCSSSYVCSPHGSVSILIVRILFYSFLVSVEVSPRNAHR